MFTGIIETVGTIRSVRTTGSGMRIDIESKAFAAELAIDDSVAVNGICLTVVDVAIGRFTIDAVRETLSRSTLASWTAGKEVNLERGLPANGRFDGHIVQGHIDGTAELVSVKSTGKGAELTFRAAFGIMEMLVEKGSVALDGISLTVAACQHDRFSVAVIPYTLSATTFRTIRPGMKVNVETDIIGKYVAKYMSKGKNLDKTTLQSWGYDI